MRPKTLRPQELPLETHLGAALRDLLLRPHRTLFPAWSWKAAALSAFFRAATLFYTNRYDAPHQALRASLIEAVFAIFAVGLFGAVSQRLRLARPLWATALFVWIAMPIFVLLAEYGLQDAAGTPHFRNGIATSFVAAAIASSFTWFAMRRGALLGGSDRTTVRHDVHALPGIARDFLLAVPRYVLHHRSR
jgi:hypothetical protein